MFQRGGANAQDDTSETETKKSMHASAAGHDSRTWTGNCTGGDN